MSDIIIHYSITDAKDEDLVPVFGDDDVSSSIPCLDFFFNEGATVELVHVGIIDEWVITSTYARFAMRRPFSATRLHDSLRPDGELLRRLQVAYRAASADTGLLSACSEIGAYLVELSQS